MTNKINCIQKVEIYGLWNRFDIIWNLNSDVNILAGVNGSGKTTILNYVYELISAHKKPDLYSGIINGIKLFFDNDSCLRCKYIKENDTIINFEKKSQNDPEFKAIMSRLEEQEGENYIKIKKSFKPVQLETYTISLEDLGMTLNELNELFNVDFIGTFDNSLKQSEAVKKLSDDNVNTELDWEIYHLQNKYLDYQLNISKRKDAVIDESKNIKEELNKIKYPQTRFLEIIDNLFSETGKVINKDKNQIEFLLDDKEITPYQLSSGEKQILIILLTVLVQDNKPSILFMDEPEISLHIEWQKKIIQYIRELNPNVQVIIATHSPALIMEGWQDKVFEVRDLIVKDKSKS
jgi:ABC-type lipoprotein export system ATPase subunit